MNERPEYYFQVFDRMSQIAVECGVRAAVLSPGSRSAPIALSFLRNKNIPVYVINDERSAAYFGLGIALFHQKPVVLVCTSGTAVLNYAPALAEAFNQRIPLMALTADRPESWIGIGENQTILQKNIFQPNIRKSYHIDVEDFKNNPSQLYQLFTEAFQTSLFPVPGPVHINLPIHEPFYPDKTIIRNFTPSETIEKLPASVFPDHIDDLIFSEIKKLRKILIVPGLLPYNPSLRKSLHAFSLRHPIPIVQDITSNLHLNQNLIHHIDLILSHRPMGLRPDLLLTIGKYTISGQMKSYLRKNRPKQHWHLDPYNEAADTYQCLTRTIPTAPDVFFDQLAEKEFFPDEQYFLHWKEYEKQANKDYFKKISIDDEVYLFSKMLELIPPDSVLHLGNSNPVRLANETAFIHRADSESIQVYSNRGTSGIDGCLSTAAGFSSQTDLANFIILGDQSFLYDSNALWNNYFPENLKIIVINNKGGNIFRKMKGPSDQPELEKYFASHVETRLDQLAKAFNMEYQKYIFNRNDLSKLKNFFLRPVKNGLLEIVTSPASV